MKRRPGALPSYVVKVLLALVLAGAGIVALGFASGSALVGIVLLLAAGGLLRYAHKARAEHLYRQRMAELGEWSQALGPRRGRL